MKLAYTTNVCDPDTFKIRPLEIWKRWIEDGHQGPGWYLFAAKSGMQYELDFE